MHSTSPDDESKILFSTFEFQNFLLTIVNSFQKVRNSLNCKLWKTDPDVPFSGYEGRKLRLKLEKRRNVYVFGFSNFLFQNAKEALLATYLNPFIEGKLV